MSASYCVHRSGVTRYGLGEGPTVAPGAEDVGRAQIVSQLAPAFNLGGLFSQADAGAFSNGTEVEMQEEAIAEGLYVLLIKPYLSFKVNQKLPEPLWNPTT